MEISSRKFTLGNIFIGAFHVSHRGSEGIGSRPFASRVGYGRARQNGVGVRQSRHDKVKAKWVG